LRLRCLLDVDVGTHRTGVAAGEPALEMAQQVAGLKGLQLVGLQGYEGHAQHIAGAQERRQAHAAAMQLLSQTAELLLDHGLPVEIVSTAGTGTCHFAAQWERVTEVQPGSYIMMDTHYRGVEGLGFETALTVLTSVISRRRDAAIVDAGLKSISSDAGPAGPRDLDARYRPFGEEHGLLTFDHGNPLVLGDKIALIPSHCDTTINLHDLYYVSRDDRIVAVWPIAARGRVQ
jgi:D-serine deaminase-like pyridoxal phosphate-dependent protein